MERRKKKKTTSEFVCVAVGGGGGFRGNGSPRASSLLEGEGSEAGKREVEKWTRSAACQPKPRRPNSELGHVRSEPIVSRRRRRNPSTRGKIKKKKKKNKIKRGRKKRGQKFVEG